MGRENNLKMFINYSAYENHSHVQSTLVISNTNIFKYPLISKNIA